MKICSVSTESMWLPWAIYTPETIISRGDARDKLRPILQLEGRLEIILGNRVAKTFRS